ncbi:MAG: hypothetical protein ACJ779_03540, partial [Chloroflexota bacterium]
RRVEPAVIGAIVVLVAIGAAIAKPWESNDAAGQPAQTPAAIAATGSPRPSPSATPAPRASAETTNWLDVAGAVSDHDSWGITAVLMVRRGSNGLPVSPPVARYLERWTPTTKDASGPDLAYVDRDDRPIAALGVTVPPKVNARSVRVWREHAGGTFEWIDAARIDNLADGRTPLLIRMPLIDGVQGVSWEAGRYRVDVLTGDGIHQIALMIPNRFGNVPEPDIWAAAITDEIPATASDPSRIQSGLFATVDGTAVSIPARESRTLGEAQAWGDTTVGAAFLPRATGLGVMLTSHAAVKAASIRRLAPEPLKDAPAASGGISNLRGRTPYVVFSAPDGVWPPGVYAVSVDWDDGAGAHHATWHVELRPGLG